MTVSTLAARLPAVLCAGLGALALVAAMASLWPGLRLAAWPAGTVAVPALALAWLPGSVLCKAFGTLCSAFALVLVAVEVGALWGLAAAIP
jgi:hypothetical protein